jgi:hypothetical protein
MEKIKIGFNPSYMWDKRDYRLLINKLLTDDAIDLYLVTDNTNQQFVDVVIAESGIDQSKVYVEVGPVALTARLTTEKINIYLAFEQSLVDYVNENAPINLEPNNVYGCQAIPTNDVLDRYYLQFRYVTHLEFWIGQVIRYNTSANGKNC